MSTSSTAAALRQLIFQLRKERQHHQDSLGEIDEALAEFNLKLEPKKATPTSKPFKNGHGRRVGGPKTTSSAKPSKKSGGHQAKTASQHHPSKKSAPKKGPSLSQTASQYVLSLISTKGSATTAEIAQQWQKSGRPGKPDNVLTQLTQAGRLLRKKVAGVRGSRYSLGAVLTAESPRPTA